MQDCGDRVAVDATILTAKPAVAACELAHSCEISPVPTYPTVERACFILDKLKLLTKSELASKRKLKGQRH